MSIILAFFGAIFGLVLAIVATVAAIRNRSNNRKIPYTVIAVVLTVIMVFLTLRLLPPPLLDFSAAAPVPSSLTLYYPHNETTQADLYALRVKDGTTRFVRTISKNAEIVGVAIDQNNPDVMYLAEIVEINSTLTPMLLALRPKDGSQIWQTLLPSQLENLWIKDGRIYGSSGDTIFAFSKSTGSEIWRASPYHYATPPNNENPQISITSGIVYVDEPTIGILFALRSDTGAIQWQIPDIVSFAANDTSVYTVKHFGALMALRAADGAPLWQVNGQFSGAKLDASAPITNGVVYLSSGSSDQVTTTFSALRMSDGGLLWSHTVDYIRWFAAWNGAMYYTNNLNEIAALRSRDGSLLWQNNATDPSTIYDYDKFIVANGVLVATSINRSDVCFGECGKVGYTNVINAITGKNCWRYEDVGFPTVIADVV